MKEKTILIGILLGILIFIPIPKYVELNHLIIIHKAKIICQNEKYQIELEEIIPKKKDNGITYQYKKYKNSDTNIKKIKKNLSKKETKKFYYQGIKEIKTNCENLEEIKKEFSIKESKIKRVKD